MRKHSFWTGFLAAVPLAAAIGVTMWALAGALDMVGLDARPEPIPTTTTEVTP